MPDVVGSSPSGHTQHSAVAHGCGPAPVRQEIRVGTGGRLLCGCSSVGRAPPRQGGGRGVIARHPLHAALAQPAEALRSGRRGSGSESRGRHEGG